jgi:mitochondrial fission protein ELM1
LQRNAAALTRQASGRKCRAMETARILCTDIAGLRAQALGLAEAAGFTPDLRVLSPRGIWRHVPTPLWVKPLAAVEKIATETPLPRLVIGCGGAGARVAAALRRPGVAVVAVQHPRMSLKKFDLVLAAGHDGITGANVIVTRTALHRVTPARLAEEAALWRPAFAQLRRPLVAVLLGGSNGRYRFDTDAATELAAQLARMMDLDGVGVVITPSRRTNAETMAILGEALVPRGAWIWDGQGRNPYFGMLGLADAIVVTADSVSMVSEAVATPVPVLLVRLQGKSSRIGAFMAAMVAAGRVRDFAGRLELWDTAPLDDTAMAGAEMRRRLGL